MNALNAAFCLSYRNFDYARIYNSFWYRLTDLNTINIKTLLYSLALQKLMIVCDFESMILLSKFTCTKPGPSRARL